MKWLFRQRPQEVSRPEILRQFSAIKNEDLRREGDARRTFLPFAGRLDLSRKPQPAVAHDEERTERA